MKGDGVRNPREANQFIGEIAKLPGWEKGHKDRYDSLLEGPDRRKLRQRFVIPSLETLTQGAKLGADYRKTDTRSAITPDPNVEGGCCMGRSNWHQDVQKT